jgi:hypothetical protein
MALFGHFYLLLAKQEVDADRITEIAPKYHPIGGNNAKNRASLASMHPRLISNTVMVARERRLSRYVLVLALKLNLGDLYVTAGTQVGSQAYWLAKIHQADKDVRIAFREAQEVMHEYYPMSRSDGNFAFAKTMKPHHLAMDKYVAMCRNSLRASFDGALR